MCGICGSDLNLLKGAESFLLEPYASLPAVLGHEVVAEVVWTKPHPIDGKEGYQFGLRFVYILEEDRQKLKHLLGESY